MVVHPYDRVSGGYNGLSRAKVALEAAVESLEGTICADDRSYRLAERLSLPVVGLERAAADEPSTLFRAGLSPR